MRLSAKKRQQLIVEKLLKEGSVNDHELADAFHVSMETIRKDLFFLEEKGVVQKEYGGAVLAMSGIEPDRDLCNDYQEYKDETARYACSLIHSFHSLILDSGTTCEACIPYLNTMPSMDIFTTSLKAAEQLDGDLHHVLVLPGRKRTKDGSPDGRMGGAVSLFHPCGCVFSRHCRLTAHERTFIAFL